MSPKEVKELRLSLGMTQEDMAEYLGLRYGSQVCHLESGRTPAKGAVLKLLYMLMSKASQARGGNAKNGEIFEDRPKSFKDKAL